MRRFGWGRLLLIIALTGIGCGSQGTLTKVQGVLTLDGKPVEDADVTFTPIKGSSGKYAFGRTRADGSFQLTTTAPNDGALPGEYTVTVQYEEGIVVPPAANMKEAKAGFAKASKKAKPRPKYVVPAQYGDPAKSPLRQKVPPDGTVKLELKSK